MHVTIETVEERILASVGCLVALRDIATSFKLALDTVWSFLGTQPGLRTDGHNIFLYRFSDISNEIVDAEFGVEVTRSFEPAGDIRPIKTPGGKVATAVHHGPYEKLYETHQAIHKWADANQVQFAGVDWEIYGDWNEDPSKLLTTVYYQLK